MNGLLLAGVLVAAQSELVTGAPNEELVVKYTFNTEASLGEWERVGPGFEDPNLWGEMNWSSTEGFPEAGALELQITSQVSSLTAQGPCLPQSALVPGGTLLLRGHRYLHDEFIGCKFVFNGYTQNDTCSGPSDIGTGGAPLGFNPSGVGEWLLYINGAVNEVPEIRSLQPAFLANGQPGTRCLADSLEVVLIPPSTEVPTLNLFGIVFLTVGLIAAGFLMMRRRI